MRLKDCAARKSMEARLLLVVWRGGMCQSNGQSREAGRVSSCTGSMSACCLVQVGKAAWQRCQAKCATSAKQLDKLLFCCTHSISEPVVCQA